MGNCEGFFPDVFHDGWWRIDPDPDIMSNDGDRVVPPFQKADLRNIEWKFNQYPFRQLKVTSQTAKNKSQKTAIISLQLINNTINLTDLKIIYNSAPEYTVQSGRLNFTVFDNNGTVLRNFLIKDPRIVITENGSIYKDKGNLTVPIPLSFKESKINIYNFNGSLLLSINMTNYLSNFCSFQDGKCDLNCGKEDADWPSGDVDLNQRVDIFDLVKVGLAYGSIPGDSNWDSKADLSGNDKIDIFDLATVGLSYGKEC